MSVTGQMLGQGCLLAAQVLTKVTGFALPTLQLGLFCNNITPSYGDINTTYTECTDSGYARIGIAGGAFWTFASASTNPQVATLAAQTFNFNGNKTLTVYGWFIADSASGLILMSCLATTPFAIPAGTPSSFIVNATWQFPPS